VNYRERFEFFKDFNSAHLTLFKKALEDKFGGPVDLKTLEEAAFVFDVISAGALKRVWESYERIFKERNGINDKRFLDFFRKMPGWQEKFYPFMVYEIYGLYKKNPSLIKKNRELLKKYYSIEFEKADLYKESAKGLQRVFFSNFISKIYGKALRSEMLKNLIGAGGDRKLAYLSPRIISYESWDLLKDSFHEGYNFFYFIRDSDSYDLSPGKSYKDFSGRFEGSHYTNREALKSFLKSLDKAESEGRGDLFLDNYGEKRLGEINKTVNLIERLSGVKVKRTRNRTLKYLIRADYIIKNLPLIASKITSLDEYAEDKEDIKKLLNRYSDNEEFLFLAYLSFFVFLKEDSEILKRKAPFAHGIFRAGKAVFDFFEENGLTERVKESFLFQNGYFYWDSLLSGGYMKKNFYDPVRETFFEKKNPESENGVTEADLRNVAESMLLRTEKGDSVCVSFLYNGFAPLFGAFLNGVSKTCKKDYDLRLINTLDDFKWEKLTDMIYGYKYVFNAESPVYSDKSPSGFGGNFGYVEDMFRPLLRGRGTPRFIKESLILGLNLLYLKERDEVFVMYESLKDRIKRQENMGEENKMEEAAKILGFFLNKEPNKEGVEFFKKHFLSKMSGKTDVSRIKKTIAFLKESGASGLEEGEESPVIGIVSEPDKFKLDVTESDLLALNLILNGHFRRLAETIKENEIKRKRRNVGIQTPPEK